MFFAPSIDHVFQIIYFVVSIAQLLSMNTNLRQGSALKALLSKLSLVSYKSIKQLWFIA